MSGFLGARPVRCRSALWGLVWCGVSVVVPMVEALAFPAGMVEPLRTAPEVMLTTASGREFRLSHHRGEIVAVVFGYTLCPDVCPMTLAGLAQVRTRLGRDADAVRVVFVTLDSKRDTTSLVTAYVRAFDPTFVALTGTPRALAQVRDAYGVLASRNGPPGAGYRVDHSSFVFVVDRAGRMRFMFPAGTSVEDMVQGITALLRERPQL